MKKSWLAATMHRYKKHTGKPHISYNDAAGEDRGSAFADILKTVPAEPSDGGIIPQLRPSACPREAFSPYFMCMSRQR